MTEPDMNFMRDPGIKFTDVDFANDPFPFYLPESTESLIALQTPTQSHLVQHRHKQSLRNAHTILRLHQTE